jgi:hypothetical protein
MAADLHRSATPPMGKSTPKRQGGWLRRGERHDPTTTTLGVGDRRKTMYGGFGKKFRAPCPSNPVTVTHPNIRECGPGLARRPTLETWMLDRYANGGGRTRAMGRLPDWYMGTITEIVGGMMGEKKLRGGISASNFRREVWAWGSPAKYTHFQVRIVSPTSHMTR